MSEDKWHFLSTLTRAQLKQAIRIEAGDASALPEGWGVGDCKNTINGMTYEMVCADLPSGVLEVWGGTWRVFRKGKGYMAEGPCCCKFEGIIKAQEAVKNVQ